MYLSEEQRAAIRACLEKNRSGSGINETENDNRQRLDSLEMRKVAQILLDARDGKEVFSPSRLILNCMKSLI